MKKKVRKTAGRKSKREPLPSTAIGFKIKAARSRAGLSLQTVADKIGISNQGLSLIETGGSNPSERTRRLLAVELKSDFGLAGLRKFAQPSSRNIPVVARVAGGRPIERMIVDESMTVGSEFANIAGKLVVVVVEGDSMAQNHVLDGDRLVCRLIENPREIRKDAMVIVRLREEFGESALKRWRIKGQEKQAIFTLSSDHNDPNAEKFSYPIWKFAEAFEPVGLVRRLT